MVETVLHRLGSAVGLVLADNLLHLNSTPLTVEDSRRKPVSQPREALASLGVAVAVKVDGLDVGPPRYGLRSSHRDMSFTS